LTLITVRSNDQFNTTVYGYEDRLRGIYGTREVVLMHEADMRSLGIATARSLTSSVTLAMGSSGRS